MKISNEVSTLNRSARRARARALGASGVLAVGGAGALLAAFAGSAGAAATITVDSSGDGVADAARCSDVVAGNCTLRDAALAAVDGDIITFDAAVTSITLTEGTVNLNAISLTGSGSANLAITTTAAPDSYDLFYVGGTGDAVISGLSLSKNRIMFQQVGNGKLEDVVISGSGADYGAALYAGNDGDLEIVNSSFDENYASSNGGAVYAYNSGSVTISGSSFTNNVADKGGALFTTTEVTGTITISASDFSGNYAISDGGVAMLYSNGTSNLVINDSTFFENSADSWAGAFYIMDSIVDVSIDGSTISGNSAASGAGGAYIENSGELTIANSTISDNSTEGGAGALYLNSGGDATITNTVISGNSAAEGAGGIKMSGDSLTINNSTITGNSALYGGGLSLYYGSTVINQSTIVGNTATGTSNGGGGVLLYDNAQLTLSGTIISGNSSVVSGDDLALYGTVLEPLALYGTVLDADVTADNSLIGDVDSRITVSGSNNISATDPMVGALADNGGATMTMALLDGSPAIDAGPDPVVTFIGNEFDQRGLPFVRIYGTSADIGAFEAQPDPEPTTTTVAPGAATDPVVPAFTG